LSVVRCQLRYRERKRRSVILSPSPVILIPQPREKNLGSWLRVNSAKDLFSSSQPVEPKKQLRRPFASLRMTGEWTNDPMTQ
jgi:hypothetical protein